MLFKSKLRILCYHGFTMKDEDEFVPGLFIQPEIFHKRMQYLADKKYNIITLQKAYDYKEQRNFPDDAVVLTIDDGFYSVFKEALPILKNLNFPATLYLTSYYFDKDCPLFNLATQYMFFKTQKTDIDLKSLAISGASSQNDPDAVQKIIDFGKKLATEEERIIILKKLGKLLDVDYDNLNKSRTLNLITLAEMKALMAGGIDIQLHTHRHRFPTEHKVATYEIEKNKQTINNHLPTPMTHFCYPSGDWSKDHWPILAEQDILTATTCEPKLIDYDMPNYSLGRILDSARVSQIEFEAELSGFNEFIRKIRKK
ncbi:MAG: polysaccharide deacetylase family protein [Emcibacter sp.]|nr:polysaccharide deacetylase family protein [Emcibacter sp.]